MKLIEIARNAKELISDPKRWTQEWEARNVDGDECEALDEDAVCWCASGAIMKVAEPELRPELYNLIKVSCLTSGMDLPQINDNLGHEATLEAFDKIVEYLHQKGEDSIGKEYDEWFLMEYEKRHVLTPTPV